MRIARFFLFFALAGLSVLTSSSALAQGAPTSPIKDAELQKWINSCPATKDIFSRAGIDLNATPTAFDATAYRNAKVQFNNLPERKAISQLEVKWWRYDSLLQHAQSNTAFQGPSKASTEKFISEEIENGSVEDRNNLVALHARLWNKPVMGAMQNITPAQIINYLTAKKQGLQNQIVPLKNNFESSGNAVVASSHLRALEASAPKGIGMQLQYLEEATHQQIKSAKTYGGRNPLTIFRNSIGSVIGYQFITGDSNGKTNFADVTLKDQCQPIATHMNTLENGNFRRTDFKAEDCTSNANQIPTRYTACNLIFGVKPQPTSPDNDLTPVNQ